MADRRIQIAKDKVELVRELQAEQETKGFFRHLVDIVAFAAALGYRENRRTSLGEVTKEPAPIRQSVFVNHGYETLIHLLAMVEQEDPKVLANSDEMDEVRATIFEEYANGGLEILQEELKGSIDYLESVLLLIGNERRRLSGEPAKEFDLSQLIE